MYPTSTAFRAAVRTSHQMSLRAEVWSGDQKVLDLYPTDGRVDADYRRAVYRTVSMTLAAPAGSGVVPDDASSALAPFGNEIRIWRGIVVTETVSQNPTYAQLAATYATYATMAAAASTYATLTFGTITTVTTTEEVPLGVFVITDVEASTDGKTATVTVSGSDRSLRIQRARWTEPYAIAAGTAVETAIRDLLIDRWVDVTTAFAVTNATTPKVVFGSETSGNPWDDAQSLATAAGFRLYFDATGVAVLEEVPDYDDSATPDASYLEDSEAVLLGVRRSLTASETYNGVIATGEGTGLTDTFRGEAWDEDPASPTYRYGNFGQVPTFYSSPLITSNAAAQSAAEAILASARGASESIDWTQIVDPALEPGDVVAVENTLTKTSTVLVIDRLTIPFTAAGTMSAAARTIRTGVA